MYESELTKFMREYLAQHPEEVESQKKGRAAWWDKDPARVAPPPAPSICGTTACAAKN